jgi:serine O-acetyltransferase
MFELLRADCQANVKAPLSIMLLAVYRYGNWLHRKVRIPVAFQVLRVFYIVACVLITYVICGSQIPAQCTIGKGLKLDHPFGIIISPDAVIGGHCSIMHQVTIGSLDGASPILENEVFIGTGAKILGPVIIGKKAIIGVNAVVLEDVPPGGTAVGIPARVIKITETSAREALFERNLSLD